MPTKKKKRLIKNPQPQLKAEADEKRYVTLRNPKQHDTGFLYDSGAPIMAWSGEEVETFITLVNPIEFLLSGGPASGTDAKAKLAWLGVKAQKSIPAEKIVSHVLGLDEKGGVISVWGKLGNESNAEDDFSDLIG